MADYSLLFILSKILLSLMKLPAVKIMIIFIICVHRGCRINPQTVQCAILNRPVHSTVNSGCTLYIVLWTRRCTLYIVLWTQAVHCTLYCKLRLYTVHSTVNSALYTVHCTVNSALYTVHSTVNLALYTVLLERHSVLYSVHEDNNVCLYIFVKVYINNIQRDYNFNRLHSLYVVYVH